MAIYRVNLQKAGQQEGIESTLSTYWPNRFLANMVFLSNDLVEVSGLDEIYFRRIYVDQLQLAELYVPETTLKNGLRLHYMLEEPTSEQLIDSGPNSFNLPLLAGSMPQVSTERAGGLYGRTGGTNNNAGANDPVLTTFGDVPFTVACWFVPGAFSNSFAFCGVGPPSGLLATWRMTVAKTSGSAAFAVQPDASSTLYSVSGGTADVNDPNLLIGWHDPDANIIAAKLNNAATVTLAHSLGTRTNTNYLLRIGRDNLSSYVGSIADLAIWDRVLTEDELEELWSDGDGVYF